MTDLAKDNTCDFCSSVPSPWTYPASYGTDWGACPTCHEIIQAGRRQELLERSIDHSPELRSDMFSREERRNARRIVRTNIKKMHDEIFWRYCTQRPYYEEGLDFPITDGETQRSTP